MFQLLLWLLLGTAQSIVIPPKWANLTANPCAKKSWQLLHWHRDQKCYHIFTQGPCDHQEEIYFNHKEMTADCRCSKGTVKHTETNRCHQEYLRGPCDENHYVSSETGGEARCRIYNECKEDFLFWPRKGKCYKKLSQGPCAYGELLHYNSSTGDTVCECDKYKMNKNYWKFEQSCHELFTQGPCVDGQVFVYNLIKQRTECACSPLVKTNFYHRTNRCYETNTVGPCRQGQIYVYNPILEETQCKCLEGYVYWLPSRSCYREYTRGPCPEGYFVRSEDERTKCVKNRCRRGRLYDPDTNQCYFVGQRGPCEKGKLWIYERAFSVRGRCHCDTKLIGYWEPHGICYQLGQRGPCEKKKILLYDKSSGEVHCRCNTKHGYVDWISGKCLKIGVRKRKIIPIAGPSKNYIGQRNNIRVHRGLTLPMEKEKQNNTSYIIQQGILNDIIKNINKTCPENKNSGRCTS